MADFCHAYGDFGFFSASSVIGITSGPPYTDEEDAKTILFTEPIHDSKSSAVFDTFTLVVIAGFSTE